jgi:NhaP-type Na+/H+ or K+/H+ antiporter
MIVHLIGIVGAMLCGLFTGAALAIGPTRPPEPFQSTLLGSLAVGSAVFGIATYLHGEGPVWLVAGVVMLVAAARWSKLPAARTAAGVIGTLTYIFGLVHL